jgi:hypothetical protein
VRNQRVRVALDYSTRFHFHNFLFKWGTCPSEISMDSCADDVGF